MKPIHAFIAVAFLAVLGSGPAVAQHCRVPIRHEVAVVKAVAVVPAPVVLYQSAYYARFDAELGAAFQRGVKEGAREALNQFYADAQAEAAEQDAQVGQLNPEDAAGVLDTETGKFTPGPGWEGPAPVAPPVPASGEDLIVKNYIATNCLKCHNGTSGKGGVDLTKLDALTLWRSADAVRHGRMPYGSGKPSDNYAEILSEAARRSP